MLTQHPSPWGPRPTGSYSRHAWWPPAARIVTQTPRLGLTTEPESYDVQVRRLIDRDGKPADGELGRADLSFYLLDYRDGGVEPPDVDPVGG